MSAKSKEKFKGPKYQVLASLDKQVEVRLYTPRIVAQIEVAGDEKTALEKGLCILGNYIIGKNKKRVKINMTAPVVAQPEKVATTSATRRVVSFFMPNRYSLETLPEPADSRIQLVELPAQRFAAIRFSGAWNPAEFNKQAAKLLSCLRQNKLEVCGAPVNAYYNKPFTLPLLRRNEVLIPLADRWTAAS